jgi:hypothetical protein
VRKARSVEHLLGNAGFVRPWLADGFRSTGRIFLSGRENVRDTRFIYIEEFIYPLDDKPIPVYREMSGMTRGGRWSSAGPGPGPAEDRVSGGVRQLCGAFCPCCTRWCRGARPRWRR